MRKLIFPLLLWLITFGAQAADPIPTLFQSPVTYKTFCGILKEEIAFLTEDSCCLSENKINKGKVDNLYNDLVEYSRAVHSKGESRGFLKNQSDEIKTIQTLKETLANVKPLLSPFYKANYCHLWERLERRETYLQQVSYLPERVNLFINDMPESVVTDPQLCEDFILAWNPGHLSKNYLIRLSQEYKRQYKLKNLPLSQTMTFYLWVDDVINDLQSAFLPWGFTKQCRQDHTFYLKNSRKVYFSEVGTAHVAYPLWHRGDKYQTKIMKGKSLKDYYVYPLQEEKRYNYVINEKGDLYILDEISGGHVDILRGGSVLCAGEIEFKDQMIYQMDSMSGHYLPSKDDLTRGYEKLKEKSGPSIFHPKFRLQFFDLV